MAETTEPEPTGIQDPLELARAVALDVADDYSHVGGFVSRTDLADGVSDFRFACELKGYEGWQWSVTLYHDAEADRWTVDESSLVPTDSALRPPAWVPWKDRLEPTDLSPTDSIGTDPDDPRLEEGGVAESSLPDVEQARDDFDLSRRHVLSPLGRAQTAKRWYEGPRGPKSLSTKTAAGNPCSTCGFFVPLMGELGTMFGVCANKWSPDDGRVVSLDHGCGEHSEIEPPEPSHLWVQSKPAFDDLHIDIIAQTPRDERSQVELLEEIVSDARHGADEDEATEEDIEAHTAAEEASEEDIEAQTVPESDEPEVVATIAIDGADAADADSDESDESDGTTPDGPDGTDESDGSDESSAGEQDA